MFGRFGKSLYKILKAPREKNTTQRGLTDNKKPEEGLVCDEMGFFPPKNFLGRNLLRFGPLLAFEYFCLLPDRSGEPKWDRRRRTVRRRPYDFDV